ncbi:MAG: UDP-N-acetylmuramoyl-L-alanyl-D-glutamate--2,6-diaminopimelate ligase, partial [Chloroflexi bacterium]|nr:UDP-N-acetylmuramoyl-L-alanyl-D-glutamate--2,6-diaminopimelate ligase [Chloroflexota bacterium]
MRLGELITRAGDHTGWRIPCDAGAVDVRGICYDTRHLNQGDLFIAVREARRDGHEFIPDALARGAAAIVVERPPAQEVSCPVLTVPHSKEALAHLAAAFYDYPSHKLRLVGVTGTDGKTTTTELTAHLFNVAHIPAGFMTTVSFDFGAGRLENTTRQSTQESPDVQRGLAHMLANGCRAAALEATSHALALHRLTSCAFDTAIVTNVTHEHLDFHGTWENYLAAKAHLLELVEQGAAIKPGRKTAVLNRDDRSYIYLHKRVHLDEISYGLSLDADVYAGQLTFSSQGTGFTLHSPWGTARVETELVGQFNVYNSLAAMTAALLEGIPLPKVVEGLRTARPVPGRMERIDEGQQFTVIVDYAHTADSLEKVLRTLRPQTAGKLWAVFGSAGERDREKRPAMGAVAARLCEQFVLTNEDPRWEVPESILDDIAIGAEKAGRQRSRDFYCIADRREAIAFAFSHCQPGDTVVLAGKGHEQCILIRDDKVPWDDRAVARELLRGLQA